MTLYVGKQKVSATTTINSGTVKNTDLTINPSTTSQSYTPSSGFTGFGKVIANPVTSSIDNNIMASNIRKNVTILGVTGSLESGGLTPTGTLSITQNGTYDVTNYANVVIKVVDTNSVTLTVEIRDNNNDNLVTDSYNITVNNTVYTIVGTLDIEVPKSTAFQWSMPWDYNYEFLPASGTLTLSENDTLIIKRKAKVYEL